MIKKILLFLILTPSLLFAQSEYVSVDNPVYDFLERMDVLKIIEHYNSFEIPKSRGEIGNYIKEIIKHEQNLDNTDKNILKDLITEFEVEVLAETHDSLYLSQSLIGKGDYSFFSEKQKYLFYHFNPGKANIFINLLAEGEIIYRDNPNLNINSGTTLGAYGGEIRGTVLNKFGFFIRGYQGQVFGSRET
ncbi:MAG: hypothetical protein EHM47_14175, partial [Ignavibacteriales bacterium]